MRLQSRQDQSQCPNGYAQCPQLPPCNCSANQSCVITTRTCNTCSQVQCRAIPGQAKAGLSTGTLAAAITGVIVLAIIACLAFFWWRRKNALRAAALEKTPRPLPKDVPASPDAVLGRPDPVEKALPSPTPADRASVRTGTSESAHYTHDPFADQASIQTASARTHSPNVITIGLIPPPDGITALSPPPHAGPTRPVRSPDLSLRPERSYEDSINLAHVNVSNDSLQPPNARFAARESQRSAVTASSRASTFSNASSALDILTEAPQIVTPKLGTIRQVLGVVKAEVIQAPGSASSPSLHPLSRVSSRPMRSPLSKSSYTPDDISETNPFGDESIAPVSSSTSVKSNSTFGQHTPTKWTFPPTPTWPVDSRPTSIQSNAGTIVADIGSATRVVFGMQSPQYSTTATAHSSVVTMGSSGSSAMPGTPPPTAATDDEERRMSQASLASSHADSILEAFPFVPPSPIAARPPRSPNGTVTFTPPSPGGPMTPPSQPPRVASLAPRLSAMSSSSGLSGLGAFPFKFSDSDAPPMPHNSRRASLDTLALSRDLEAFPLPYDHDHHSSRDSFAASTK